MQEKEYLIETRIRNNKLYKLIMENYESIAEFCRVNNLSQQSVGAVLNFKQPLYNKQKQFSKIITQLLEVFNCKIEAIVPLNYYVRSTNKFLTELDEEEMLSLSSNINENLMIENDFDSFEIKDEIYKALNTLPYKLREAVSLKYLEDKNFTEIAKALSISKVYAKYLVEKGICYLKHPSRCKNLVSLIRK